jgi:hypothetical protein
MQRDIYNEGYESRHVASAEFSIYVPHLQSWIKTSADRNSGLSLEPKDH